MQPSFTGETQVGECRLELRVPEIGAAWDSSVTGELRLSGGERAQVINRLEVILSNPPDGPAVGRHSSFEMDATRFHRKTISPQQEEVLPFSLRMGWGVGFAEPVPLRVIAQFNRMSYALITAAIHALPPPAFVLVAEIAAEEAQVRVGGWATFSAGDGVMLSFKIRKEMREVFDDLSLRLYRGAGKVYGSFTINRREYSLGDRLRAAVGFKAVTVDLRLPIGDQDATRSFFRKTLRPYVHAVRELPIPAGPFGAAADHLPRPSQIPRDES